MEVIIALKLSLKINSTKVVKKKFTSTAKYYQNSHDKI